MGEDFDGELAYSCLMVANDSEEDICVYAAISQDAASVADTLLPADLDGEWQAAMGQCKVPSHGMGATFPTVEMGNGYVSNLAPGGVVRCFVVHADTLARYGYDEVRNGNRVLVRYDLTEDDLLRRFNIVFPPDESMADVKMYPDYSYFNRYR